MASSGEGEARPEGAAPPAGELESTLERTLSGERSLPDELPGEGSRIGRLVLLDLIGRGGMGVVYRAYDPVLDRRVAVKLLRGGGQHGDSQGTARLAREAQAMARLSHPNVVAVYDSGVFEQSLFVAMEFVQGVTLAHWLAVRPRTWREVVAMFLQAGRGLMAAHAAGLVHRDFKPANVLVGEDGRARVTDFGLARTSTTEAPRAPTPALPVNLDTPLTLVGTVMGTPGYMAPEQYAGQEATPATDQYAFCVALYEALYGHLPFEGGDLETLGRLTQEGRVPPPPRGSAVPGWVAELIRVGLAPDPSRRHPSMAELLKRLEDDPSRRRARRLSAGVAVGVGLLLTSGLWWWPRLRASTCHRDTDRLAALWNPTVAARVDQAFRQTGLPFAETSSSLVRASLDAFAAAWAAERHRACDDTLRRGERTERELSLRLSCLDERRAELTTLVDGFQQVTAASLANATAAVSRLTPIARCGNVDALEQRASYDEARRAAVEALELRLAEGRALVALGRFDDARAVLEPATRAARAVPDDQALALATFELGSLELSQERFAPARDALTEATRLALTIGDARTAVHGLGLLASVHGWRLDEPKVGLALVEVGRGLTARVNDPFLEGVLEEGRGDACWRASNTDCARAAYEAARRHFERAQGPNGLDVARMHSSIGWILMEQGALTAARGAFERSRAAPRHSSGPTTRPSTTSGVSSDIWRRSWTTGRRRSTPTGRRSGSGSGPPTRGSRAAPT